MESNVIKFTSAVEDFEITGIAEGFDGRRVTFINWTDYSLSLKAEDGRSVAVNRIYGQDIIVESRKNVTLIYDNDEQRWIII